MQERDVQVFVEGTQNYFQEVSGVTPEIGLPYLKGSEESLRDMAGEIANTISGNARRSFGSNFMISVPIVIVGSPTIELPMGIPTYIIPLTWQGYKSYIVAGIE